MRNAIAAALLLAIVLPHTTFADITSRVEADADSGGNTVAPGGFLRTGDQEASVFEYTSVGGTGQTETRIETVLNGIRTVDVRTEQLPARKTVDVRVPTSSMPDRTTGGADARATIRIGGAASNASSAPASLGVANTEASSTLRWLPPYATGPTETLRAFFFMLQRLFSGPVLWGLVF